MMILEKMATIIWPTLISVQNNKWRELLNNNKTDITYHVSVDLPAGEAEADVVDECVILVVSEIKYFRVCYISKQVIKTKYIIKLIK